jgi:pSer/pThr/pTyr-binding forkhead associated (FHA) protein
MKHDIKRTRPIPALRPSKKGRGNRNEVAFGKLVIIYGDHAGREYRLGSKGVLIGREDQCGITINDSSVSRKHASVERKDGRFLLQDLKSTNGTLVNDESIDVHILSQGDKIRIGRTVFQFLGREITLTLGQTKPNARPLRRCPYLSLSQGINYYGFLLD